MLFRIENNTSIEDRDKNSQARDRYDANDSTSKLLNDTIKFNLEWYKLIPHKGNYRSEKHTQKSESNMS